MPPRSKRARKQKDRVSLKGKQRAVGQSILDEDNEYDANAFILTTKPSDADDQDAASTPAPPQLSKSQQRKQRRLQEEKERREKRAEVMSTLVKHQLAGEELGLLRSVSTLGQKESKKEGLRRALKMQRAGVDLPSNVQLLKERPAAPKNSAQYEDEEDDDEEIEVVAGSSKKSGASDGGLAQWKQDANGHRSADSFHGEYSGSSDDDDDDFSSDDDDGHRSTKRQKRSLDAAARAAELRKAVEAAKAEIGDAAMHEAEDEEFPSRPATATTATAPSRKGSPRVVLVQRTPEIEQVRSNLPILGLEQEIMEAIAENDVVVLCGETGCGKTTQLPQFLFEAGYGNSLFPERSGAIGVTQPRRVAAVSTAGRVAEELGSKLGEVVGYQVRYDKKVGASTAVKFMTDGILLREVQEDFLLRKYSAIVVDEAHERSLNTDILLGTLSRIVGLRRTMSSSSSTSEAVFPLKLIIMSATLRTEDFVGNRKLFPAPPPVLSVPARQYPVTVHFSRRTEMYNYVDAAFKKVCQIHRNLPPGGVLVFLTGQREVEFLCRKLRQTFSLKKKGRSNGVEEVVAVAHNDGYEDAWASGADAGEADAGAATDEALLLSALEDERTGGADRDDFNEEDASSGDEDEEEVVILGGEGFSAAQIAEAEQKFNEQLNSSSTIGVDENENTTTLPVHVLPLYAMLPPAEQARVFQKVPSNSRLIIVATNVAETSLTIPGIRYVVDTGRSKQRLLENAAGLARFEVRWVSKASAEQRSGRAGRTGPGHCYRLFSSAHFNDTFPKHTPPEIANVSLEGVVLSLKALGVDKVGNFPFPTAPEAAALVAAERCLVSLGALDPGSGRLTQIGTAMARYPISPRHSRMLLEALRAAEDSSIEIIDVDGTASTLQDNNKNKKKKNKKQVVITPEIVLRYAVGLAAVLSVESPFINISTLGDISEDAEKEGEDDEIITSVDDKRRAAAKKEESKKDHESARAAHARLRVPESDALSALCALCAFEASEEDEAFCRANHLLFKNLREAAALRKQLSRIVASQPSSSAFSASLHDALPSPPPPAALEALRRAIAAGWADQVSRRVRSLEYVRGHANSATGKNGRAVRYRSCTILDEEVYLHPSSALHASTPDYVIYSEVVRTVKRPYMAGLTAVDPRWLSTAPAPMCTFSAPLMEPPPFYNAASDAVLCWQDVTFGALDWPLPRRAGPHPDATERCAVFAAALLDGSVLKGMAAMKQLLAVSASMAAKPEMRMHRRVADLIAALLKRHENVVVDSKKTLAAAWKKDPNFLKVELKEWMQKGAAARLEAAWPALLAECGV